LRAIFVGGGTGGHINPALTVAERLLERVPGCEVLYVGTKGGLEADLVPRRGLPFATIEARGLFGKSVPNVARGAVAAALGLLQSLALVRRFRPDVVIGTGGYVSGPVILAAAILRKPSMLIEVNVLPGMAVRALARWVTLVTVPVPSARRYYGPRVRVEVSGSPVRAEVLTTTREAGAAAFNLAPDRKTVVVFGGSRGSRTLNEAALHLVRIFAGRPDRQLIWATGKDYFDEMTKRLFGEGYAELPANIRVEPFLYRAENALAAADLIVCRAGGTTLAEITARGIAAILVPSPVVTHHHQDANAQAVAQSGGAVVIVDEEATGDRITREVSSLLADEPRLTAMSAGARRIGRPEATDRLVELVIALARNRFTPPVPRGGGEKPWYVQ
jgi:UDP-N-acetylglucosamine--N-acetylmuramyl-(pentapeptide) pyrophosphoryl-undecaprenol N-acetylglucosamine transferase